MFAVSLVNLKFNTDLKKLMGFIELKIISIFVFKVNFISFPGSFISFFPRFDLSHSDFLAYTRLYHWYFRTSKASRTSKWCFYWPQSSQSKYKSCWMCVNLKNRFKSNKKKVWWGDIYKWNNFCYLYYQYLLSFVNIDNKDIRGFFLVFFSIINWNKSNHLLCMYPYRILTSI